MSGDEVFAMRQEKSSEWRCELFGMGEGCVYQPPEDKVPNRFWRIMQYLIFGNKWIRTSNVTYKNKED